MFVQELLDSYGKRVSAFTVFPSYKWIALGTYFNKTGGLDTLKTNEITKTTLYAALGMFPEYDVLMEGIMASTIRSTYIDLFQEVESAYDDVKALIISLLPPVEIAIDRVYSRNGGKPIKEDAVRGKWNTVEKNVKYFADAGFDSVRVNSAKVGKDRMLSSFLRTVEKHRRD